jgi:hypothetical protein
MPNMLYNTNIIVGAAGATAFTSTASTVSTGITGVTIDMSGWEGVLGIAAFSSIVAAGVVSIAYQDGSVNSTVSSDFTTRKTTDTAASTGAATATTVVIDIVKPLRRYGRFVVSNYGAGANVVSLIALQYGGSKFPRTQSTAHVRASETYIST